MFISVLEVLFSFPVVTGEICKKNHSVYLPILYRSLNAYLPILYLGLGRSNFGQGHVFRVRSKPSKQPLGLVARGVPIEKVRAMHLDWGGPTLDPSGK